MNAKVKDFLGKGKDTKGQKGKAPPAPKPPKEKEKIELAHDIYQFSMSRADGDEHAPWDQDGTTHRYDISLTNTKKEKSAAYILWADFGKPTLGLLYEGIEMMCRDATEGSWPLATYAKLALIPNNEAKPIHEQLAKVSKAVHSVIVDPKDYYFAIGAARDVYMNNLAEETVKQAAERAEEKEEITAANGKPKIPAKVDKKEKTVDKPVAYEDKTPYHADDDHKKKAPDAAGNNPQNRLFNYGKKDKDTKRQSKKDAKAKARILKGKK